MKKVIILSEEEYDELLNNEEKKNFESCLIESVKLDLREVGNEPDAKKVEMFDFLVKQSKNISTFEELIETLSGMATLSILSVKQQRITEALEKGFELQYRDEYEMGKAYEGNDGIRFKEFKVVNDFVHGKDFWVFRGQKVLLNPKIDYRVFTVLDFDEFNFTVDLVTLTDGDLYGITVSWADIGSCLRDEKTKSYFDYSQMTVIDENGRVHELFD